MTASPGKIEPSELRKAFGGFLTGVTVATTIDVEGKPRGFTANSFTSVSLDPPLLLICISRRANSYSAFMETDRFAVNILAEDQRSVSNTFASKESDKFADVAWKEVEGVPFIQGSLVSFACAVQDRVDGGDHMILLGRILDFTSRGATPLGFHFGNYVDFSLGRYAVEAHDSDISIGAILEYDGKVLVLDRGNGIELPQGSSLGETNSEIGSLFHLLNQCDIKASINFIYSVYHDENGKLFIYYIGSVDSAPASSRQGSRLVPFDEIDWVSLSEHARFILKRYISERESNRFGIFVGNKVSNTVKGFEPEVTENGPGNFATTQ